MIGEVLSDQPTFRRCYVNCLRRKNQRETLPIETELDPRENEFKPTSFGDLAKEDLDDPNKKVRIGVTLTTIRTLS